MSIIDDLIRDEGGYRLKPYDDATGKELKPGDVLVGNITIAGGVNLSAGISGDEAIYLTEGRKEKVQSELRRNFHWYPIAPEAVQEGLENLAFNQGLPTLIAKSPRMLSCLAAGDYAGAARELLDGPYKDQVGERAQRIADLFRSCATQEK